MIGRPTNERARGEVIAKWAGLSPKGGGIWPKAQATLARVAVGHPSLRFATRRTFDRTSCQTEMLLRPSHRKPIHRKRWQNAEPADGESVAVQPGSPLNAPIRGVPSLRFTQ